MAKFLFILFLLLYNVAMAQFKGVVVNEFSQGNTGSREYIELLVVGKRTCNDSLADIRGWIIDDQNGWYGNTNGADGHYRFKDIPQWSAVPFGSVILLYNSASGQKNLSITAADDPTDANKDLAYILPINSAAVLEEADNEPTNTSGTNYVYPAASSTAGYGPATNTWTFHMALNNTGGDVLSVISRTKRDSAYFSIGYGYTIATGFRQPSVAIANVPSGAGAALSDSNYTVAAKWTITTVPGIETPGGPNGGVNTSWIMAMRRRPAAQITYTTACSDGPYRFFNQVIQNTGAYTVLSNNTNGCVDTNYLYVVIKTNDVKDTVACDSLVYKGNVYKSNKTITDVIKSSLIDCDSIVRTLNITIRKSSSSQTNACRGIGQSYVFNGNTYTTSGSYASMFINREGCDSVARLSLVITALQSQTISGCGSVFFNGKNYSTSTIVYDTILSRAFGCDSIIKEINIKVNPVKSSFVTACMNEGDTYNFNGQPITTGGFYTATLSTAAGCDSTIALYINFKKRVIVNHLACDSITWNNKTLYQSTVIYDTLKSVVFNCDSVITTHNLVVSYTAVTKRNACASGPYNFYNQVLTAGGHYTHVLQTAAGCDSIIQLYLVITQSQTRNVNGCDSVKVDNNWYYSSVMLKDTLRSIISGCDSVINTNNIVVNKTKHSNIVACGVEGQPYNFNGQLLTTGGNYSSIYSTQPCDSTVHLYLVMTKQQTLNLNGCDSITYNGVTYYSSTTVQTKIKSTVSACDSLIITTNILINYTKHRQIVACIKQGENYFFNGQNLTAAGFYTTNYSTTTCDSIIHLQLSVAQTSTIIISGCDSVFFNNQKYFNSTQIIDTTKNNVGCDSVYKVSNIIVSKPVTVRKNVCLQPGERYFFNGQWLNSSGQYTAVYNRQVLCDSTVHLSLVIKIVDRQPLSGCATVQHNGITYTASATISDTLKSILNNCDSLISTVEITVYPKPVIITSANKLICAGDAVLLTAFSATGASSWLGYGDDTITVKPTVTTVFTAQATDVNGCTNTAAVTITVQGFNLALSTTTSTVLSGNKVIIQSQGTNAYEMLQWLPQSIFTQQTAKQQYVIIDTSVTVTGIALSAAGCYDTASIFIEAMPLDDIYIPNAFTPNGDGKNDVLRIRASSIISLEFTIYNRWGQVVFYTKEKSKGWDGSIAGKTQPADTYIYTVKATLPNGKVAQKKGTITLIR